MKQCPSCQANNSDTAKFCDECGFNFKKYEEEQAKKNSLCPLCGAETTGKKFCPECGARLQNPNAKATSDLFADDWLTDMADITTSEVSQKRQLDAQEQNQQKLSAFCYEEHTDGTYTVTALKDRGALRVVIPEGVVAIADSAFENSDLLQVSLPNSLMKIGKRAFAGCQYLSDLTLPGSLRVIEDEAFADCTALNIAITGVAIVGKDVLRNTANPEEQKKAKENRAEELFSLGLEKYQAEEYEEAIDKLAEAATLGNADAMYIIGTMYMLGKGVEYNWEEAHRWLTNAHQRGVVEASVSLATLYHAKKEYQKAFVHFREATQIKNPKYAKQIAICAYHMGLYYDKGYGTKKDPDAAFACFQSAVDAGHVSAEYELGMCYMDGKGTPQDFEKALTCLQNAAEKGNKNAIDYLTDLSKQMEEDERKEREAEEKRRAEAEKEAQKAAKRNALEQERAKEAMLRREGNFVYFGAFPQRKYPGIRVPRHPEFDEQGYTLLENVNRTVRCEQIISLDQKSMMYLVEPLRWRILQETDDYLRLMCTNVIAIRPFDKLSNHYMRSDIRAWLNEEFFRKAFNKEAQKKVLLVTVANDASTTADPTNRHCSPTTEDMVFLPSYQNLCDPAYGFLSPSQTDPNRLLACTDYAQHSAKQFLGTASTEAWWTRSPSADDSFSVLCVEEGKLGEQFYTNYCSAKTPIGVVPIILVSKK